MRQRSLLLCVGLLALLPFTQIVPGGVIGGPGGIAWTPSSASGLLTNLVAYWKMDELSGTRAKTAGSATSADFSAVNAPTARSGGGGYAASFLNASSQYLSSTASELNIGNANHTVAAWVLIPTGAPVTDTLVSKHNGTSNEFVLDISGGQFRYFVNNASSIAQVAAVSDAPTLLVGSFSTSDNKARISKNGAASVAGSAGALSGTSAAAFRVAARAQAGSEFYATATIGPVMVWSSALSDSDAATLYNSGSGYSCSGLPLSLPAPVACWDLNEASGTRAASTSARASCTTNCDLGATNAPTRVLGLAKAPTLGMGAYAISTSSQALSLADNADISTGDVTFTAACWALSNSLGNKFVLDKTDEYRLGLDASNKWFAKTGTTDTATDSGAATVDTWYLVAGGYNGTQTWLSVNGATKVTTAKTVAPTDTANALRVFSTSAGGNYWDGAADACGFWKGSELSTAQLTAWYAGGSGVEYPWSSIAQFFDRPGQWADMEPRARQFAVWLKYGEIVPLEMIPSRKVRF